MHRSEVQMTSAVSTPSNDEHELRNTTNTAWERKSWTDGASTYISQSYKMGYFTLKKMK